MRDVMHRREIIKGLGAGIGAALFGATKTSADKTLSAIESYEKYCLELIDKHQGYNTTETAIQTKRGEIHDPAGVGKRHKLFSLRKDFPGFAGIEQVRFDDGEVMKQVFREKGQTILISIGDRQFEMDTQRVTDVLNSRLQSVQNKLDVHGPSRLENHGSDVGTNSSDSDYFLEGESDMFNPPFLIADTHTDYNDVIDRTECSTSSTVAGAAGAIVAMETTIYNGVPDGDSLVGGFSGDYKWSSFNALSNSTAEVWCEMFDENGNTFDKDFVFNETAFPAEILVGGNDF